MLEYFLPHEEFGTELYKSDVLYSHSTHFFSEEYVVVPKPTIKLNQGWDAY